MPGMGTSLKIRNPVVTEHFASVLRLQILIVLGIAIVAMVITAIVLRRRGVTVAPSADEFSARRLLRIGFGILWIIAGLLQLQSAMPIGLPQGVVAPSIENAPGWLAHFVTLGTDAWLRHPIIGAAATIWIQVGLGIWLLAAREGWWSRSAGWCSAAWAFVIWVIGNGLGGFFIAPISWMFGAPGATFFYVVAGIAIGLPPAFLRRRSVALWSAKVAGVGFLALGILQAWPGRGFWGPSSRGESALRTMADGMAGMSQPAINSSIENWFSNFTVHGSWLVNLIVVVTLVVVGIGLLRARSRELEWVVMLYTVVAIADWVLVQDMGIFGGVGTDVNSMIPSIVVVVALWLMVREGEVGDREADQPQVDREIPEDVMQARRRARVMGSAASAAVFGFGALGMLSLGILPGASADAALAAGSGISPLSGQAPAITLTDQNGVPFSLTSLRGKVVVLSFLDPVCTSDCPIEAQEIKQAADRLGPNARVAYVAVNANPLYRSTEALRTFDVNEGLSSLPSWHFLTGTKAQLSTVWDQYGVTVAPVGAGGMVSHAEPIFIIDANGNLVSTWTVTSGPSAQSILGQSTATLIVNQVKAAR